MLSSAANQKNRNRNSASPRPGDPNSVPQLSLPQRIAARLQTTLGLALLGSILVYASLPPWNLWQLAWIAPLPWLLLIRQPELTGRHPYRTLWLAGFIFWLAAIHWLRLPHWTTYFGWLALSFYLAFYLPVFVGLTRVAVHRLGISIILAAPIVWTGLELARGHLFSGFTMGSLSHTQIHWPEILQAADIFGDYAISGLIMFIAACVARIIPWRGAINPSPSTGEACGELSQTGRVRVELWPLLPLAIALAAAIGYGNWRLAGQHTRPGPTIALIQGSIDVAVKERQQEINHVLDEYLRLTKESLVQSKKLDLVVWPETMFRYPLFSFAADFKPPSDNSAAPPESAQTSMKNLTDLQNLFRLEIENAHQLPLPPPLLLGIDAVHYTNQGAQVFNSALFVDSQGNPLARYDKMHPVMFGEYIPLADYFPFLYRITPLTGGLTSGHEAVSQKLGDVRYAPNICYETVIPHLIRRQILQLCAQGEEPDVLVNLTNDGWFCGSSELDMHLACGVMRAIEMRKPLVIAANTGFSASIDSDGRIIQQGKRRAPEVLIADVQLDTRHSFYLDHGDWFSGLCLAACVAFGVVGIWTRNRHKA